jgi:hypothetical protein
MSEQTQNNSQQMIVIALVVIAALLAAIVGVVIYQTTKQVPAPTAAAETPAATTNPPAGMGASTTAPAADAPFDAKTATKVPAGMTPETVVRTYLDDVIAGKFAEAYKFLPAANSYGSAASFESQVKPYGITQGNMGKPVTSGDTVTIAAEQVTPQMPITYTWTFKKVGDQWFVASRAMGGSVK